MDEGALAGRLARRLDDEGPLGVAVSGGGDSVALLYALAEWGRRPLHVFCVDHGLNPASGGWTQGVADHARRLGAALSAKRARARRDAGLALAGSSIQETLRATR